MSDPFNLSKTNGNTDGTSNTKFDEELYFSKIPPMMDGSNGASSNTKFDGELSNGNTDGTSSNTKFDEGLTDSLPPPTPIPDKAQVYMKGKYQSEDGFHRCKGHWAYKLEYHNNDQDEMLEKGHISKFQFELESAQEGPVNGEYHGYWMWVPKDKIVRQIDKFIDLKFEPNSNKPNGYNVSGKGEAVGTEKWGKFIISGTYDKSTGDILLCRNYYQLQKDKKKSKVPAMLDLSIRPSRGRGRGRGRGLGCGRGRGRGRGLSSDREPKENLNFIISDDESDGNEGHLVNSSNTSEIKSEKYLNKDDYIIEEGEFENTELKCGINRKRKIVEKDDKDSKKAKQIVKVIEEGEFQDGELKLGKKTTIYFTKEKENDC